MTDGEFDVGHLEGSRASLLVGFSWRWCSGLIALHPSRAKIFTRIEI
jgi:hypothetical protein